MRVAVFVDAFPSVSETFVLNQVTGLLDQGHEVHVCARRSAEAGLVHPDFASYGLADRVYYSRHRPRGLDDLLAGLRATGRAVLRNPRASLRQAFLEAPTPVSGIQGLWRFPESPLPRARYDILLCHFGPNGLEAMNLRSRGLISGRLAVFFHGYDVSEYPRRRGERAYSRLFREATLVFPVCGHWKRRLVALGCPEAKIRVHPMGVDCDRFRYVECARPEGAPARSVSVARLAGKKGLEYGIRAVAALRRTYPGIHYTIIGEGPLRQDLERLIAELDAGPAVTLAGALTQPDVIRHLEQSDIFLAPSVTAANGEQEGIPVSLMEGMATGLPAVASDHGGIPELVSDGISGFLVPERDPDAIRERLITLIHRPELRREMGARARAEVLARHDIVSLNRRLAEILKEASNAA